MLAISLNSPTKVGAFSAFAPRSSPPAPRLSVCRCQAPGAAAQSRRSLLAGGAAGAAALLAAAPALAFGNGIPGYDINMDARKRAQDRIKKEMEADLERAAEYRRKLKEQKAAAAGGGAAPAAGN